MSLPGCLPQHIHGYFLPEIALEESYANVNYLRVIEMLKRMKIQCSYHSYKKTVEQTDFMLSGTFPIS